METKKQKTKEKKPDLIYKIEFGFKEVTQEKMRTDLINVLSRYAEKLSYYEMIGILDFVKQDIYLILQGIDEGNE